MKMKNLFLILILVLTLSLFSAEIKNDDMPARGEFRFRLNRIWEVESAENDVFAEVRQVLIADDGTVYLYDSKNLRYYIFNKAGRFVRAFGKKGEGPGEIKRLAQAPTFLAGDKVIIQDTGRIHYFTREGKYVRSVLNNHQTHRPIIFLNEKEFLSAPRTLLDVPDGKARIRKINLETGEEKVITEFSLFEGGVVQEENIQAAVISNALTPMMIIGLHDSRLYFGMNDKYQVHIAGMDGKVKGTFSLKRKKSKVSNEEKQEKLMRRAKGRAPKELLITLAKRLPNEETYFNRIESHSGLIYLFRSHHSEQNTQQIDIFTPAGKYLYRAFIIVNTDYKIVSRPMFSTNNLYLVLENTEGDITLVKYQTTLHAK